jgi:hypothetical protein
MPFIDIRVHDTGGTTVSVLAGLAVGIVFVVMITLSSPFNAMRDNEYEGLKIMMKKSSGDCFSIGCFDYDVKVDGNGIVYFKGYDYVNYLGSHYSIIYRDDLEQLINEINKIDFFNLDDRYGEESDGGSWTRITVTMNGKTKTITNYDDDRAPEVYSFENKIDESLSTGSWLYRK